jgi:pimeloyl-ACP methyl ester carboxylesterase
MMPLFDRPFLEIVHRLMFAPGAPPPAWRGSYPFDRILAPAGTIANGEDLLALHPLLSDPQDWSDIDVPVTILSGAGDLVIDDQRQALPLAAMLPRACHRRLLGGGHMLHHSHPKAVIEAVSALA